MYRLVKSDFEKVYWFLLSCERTDGQTDHPE